MIDQHSHDGFTMMEMLIVIAIIGILVAITIPSYRTYTRRAHYTEIVQAAAPYKLGVEECYQIIGELLSCSDGNNGVPAGIVADNGTGLVKSIEIKENGVIIVTPQEKYGISASENYILTPIVQAGKLIWNISGGGVAAGYAD